MGLMMIGMILAFLWGFAEATFFFIIPDVIITLLALHGFQSGLNASLLALAGALLGGSGMYWWGRFRDEKAYRFVLGVPAIGEKMMQQVQIGLKTNGLFAMVLGPLKGIPYKSYAVLAPRVGIGFISFLVASIPARFIRFILTALVAWVLAEKVFPNFPMSVKYIVWSIVWVIVYIIYFRLHPWSGDKKEK